MSSLGVPLDFCVGVAGYPEKHFMAPSLKQDMYYLKIKLKKVPSYWHSDVF